MNFFQRILGIQLYGSIRKDVFCKLGFHGPKTGLDGKPANVCCWGCGLVYNKDMWKDYIVTLKNGDEFPVTAVNEFHAGSMVVYGNQRPVIDGKTGRSRCDTVVHRDNIKSVRLKGHAQNN